MEQALDKYINIKCFDHRLHYIVLRHFQFICRINLSFVLTLHGSVEDIFFLRGEVRGGNVVLIYSQMCEFLTPTQGQCPGFSPT